MAVKLQKFKIGNWIRENNFFVKETILYGVQCRVFDIYDEFLENVKQVGELDTIANLGENTFKRSRNKGEEQSDYVANMSGMGQETVTHSHYTKDSDPITLTLPDGTQAKGVIRVANHTIDVGTFMSNNNFDFCISLVVGEKPREYPDKPINNNDREVHIFEYVLDKKFENKERILMQITDRIVFMKVNGWNVNTDVGIRQKPKEISNKTIKYIKENDLRNIIQEEIVKVLKSYNLI